jgi:hypothetical protein
VLCYTLINISYATSVQGINRTPVDVTPNLSVWWWHIIYVLGYIIVPITALMINNEKSWLTVMGASIIGIIMTALRGFTLIVDFPLTFILLDSVAAILSLVIAVDIASLKAAAARLSVE